MCTIKDRDCGPRVLNRVILQEFLREHGVILDQATTVIRQAAVTRLADNNSESAGLMTGRCMREGRHMAAPENLLHAAFSWLAACCKLPHITCAMSSRHVALASSTLYGEQQVSAHAMAKYHGGILNVSAAVHLLHTASAGLSDKIE